MELRFHDYNRVSNDLVWHRSPCHRSLGKMPDSGHLCSYGDKTPRTAIGRSLAIAWILIGIVMISLFTSFMSTGLTSITLGRDPMIYGSKVSTPAPGRWFSVPACSLYTATRKNTLKCVICSGHHVASYYNSTTPVIAHNRVHSRKKVWIRL